MTPDPWAELRRLRDDILAELGDSPGDHYEREAMLMAWESHTGENAFPLMDTLRVEMRGEDIIGAYAAGEILKQFQSATALIDRYRRNPRARGTGISRRDRERAQIVLEGQAGSTIVFRVPAVAPEMYGLDIGQYAGRASKALAELMETLPETADESLQGILGAPPLVREAVHRISRAALQAEDGLGLQFRTGENELTSVLSYDKAQLLTKFLSDKEFIEDEETVEGLLDGMRGTRRVFYLVDADRSEISGAVEADLIPQVHELLGRHVIARLATTQWHKRLGRYGDKTYRLLSVEPAPEQGNFDDEWR
ncbi:hypothetical protein ACQPW1_39865 [Nocardia sp. CA-128927]|uniref:hypothetical protein n=1 Tax=Nocardia sp. CA-128927 TaxID=3239975 RepID=UPI003D994384